MRHTRIHCKRVFAYMHTRIRVLGWRVLCVYFGSDISELHCIWWPWSFVSTGVGVFMLPSCTKPDSGITTRAVINLVTNDTYSCFETTAIGTQSIETFLVTVELQWGLRTNQRLPRVTAQWSGAVLPISDQWVQRDCSLPDDNKTHLLLTLHSEANLRKWFIPVGG